MLRAAGFDANVGVCGDGVVSRCAVMRSRTFRVIREHASSTSTLAGHVMEPTETTIPALAGS